MPRKYTEARKENNKKWDSENLDRLSLALPKGHKEVIQAAAAASGEKSVNAWIGAAIEARLSGAPAPAVPEAAQKEPAALDTLSPEILAKVNEHLELFHLDRELFFERAIAKQIEIDRLQFRMGATIETNRKKD